jgi:succinoglycan biosynthesis protein ExoU
MAHPQAQICVVVAARNAGRTIGRAVGSALAEPEVAEVVVVDDASQDDTAAMARAADDNTARLSVIRLDINRGPAAARNLAIAQSSAPLIGILDADDFLVPGRFAAMLATTDWDLVADNVMFVTEGSPKASPEAVPRFMAEPAYLRLPDFIEGNISRARAHRAELGFLKPLVRRAFLDQHRLRYDEALRLGEDYELYVRALARGARFQVIKSCGYAATERPDSLSGRHSTLDLERLADADLRLLENEALDAASRRALELHERNVRNKFRFRRFLDLKAEQGSGAALRFWLASPANALPIGRSLARARLRRLTEGLAANMRRPSPQPRFLMPGRLAEGEGQG